MNLRLLGFGIGAVAIVSQAIYIDYLSNKVESQIAAIDSLKSNTAAMRVTIEEMGAWAKATDSELKKHSETVRQQEQAFRVLKQQVAKAYESDAHAKSWGSDLVPESLRRLLSEDGSTTTHRGHEARDNGDAVRK